MIFSWGMRGKRMKKKSLMLVMLTLVLALGMSMQVSAKTKVKTYKVTYVLNGGTNNKKNTSKYK